MNRTCNSEKWKQKVGCECTKTYVNSDIAAELNLKGTLERVNIGILNGRSASLETM